ncbi:MAG: M48 family metallopeptidase [Firmicutes bacterium]|nr:M48 family metallopeptidase [Bacillota bacterium]
MSRQEIEYFGIPIEFELTRKQVKNINIRINEEGIISVSAGKSVPVEDIRAFVESRAEWIIRNLADLERYNSAKPDNDIYNGKKLYILGNVYTARVEEAKKDRVEVEDGIVTVYTKDTEDSERMIKTYKKWLVGVAEPIFQQLLEKVHKQLEGEGIPMPEMHIRNMKTRWGSCKVSDKVVTLNLQLIKNDIACIEQVVLHELLHFVQPNHGEEFYVLLEKYMPDWKERKQHLEEKCKDGIF